jgi:hypothetical protein
MADEAEGYGFVGGSRRSYRGGNRGSFQARGGFNAREGSSGSSNRILQLPGNDGGGGGGGGGERGEQQQKRSEFTRSKSPMWRPDDADCPSFSEVLRIRSSRN